MSNINVEDGNETMKGSASKRKQAKDHDSDDNNGNNDSVNSQSQVVVAQTPFSRKKRMKRKRRRQQEQEQQGQHTANSDSDIGASSSSPNAHGQKEDEYTSPSDRAQTLCRIARNLWLNATCQDDMNQVEELLREALNMKKAQSKSRKSNRSAITAVAALSRDDYRRVGEQLSLLYIQSQRSSRAKAGLQYLGFQCRLASHVLDYPTPSLSSSSPVTIGGKSQKKKNAVPPCIILDEFLSGQELAHLRSIFASPTADYWTSHKYSVEPPSPYFSYIVKIPKKQKNGGNGSGDPADNGFLYKLIDKIWNCHHLRTKFPDLARAHFVEMWAHNRPHASGHQLHFDSDNEGLGGDIRNPIISTILYLTTEDEDCVDGDINNSRCGGPSLITNQRLRSTSLASKGWLAHSCPRRLVAFDGGVLHGVIPGKGYIRSKDGTVKGLNCASTEVENHIRVDKQPRRVTLMLAFWKDIKIRPSYHPGAARPWPAIAQNTAAKSIKTTSVQNRSKNEEHESTHPLWPFELMREDVPVSIYLKSKLTTPLALSHVYEDLDGAPWSSDRSDTMPEYDQVFQGF